MKKLKIITGIFLLIISSCSKPDVESFTDESLTALETEIEDSSTSSMIDPDTPLNAIPSIKNSKENISGMFSKSDPTPKGVSGDWALFWSDEFNGSKLNKDKWMRSKTEDGKTRGLKNRPESLKRWAWQKDHAFLNDRGQLILKATKPDNKTMYCGSVETRNRCEFKYGFFEAKIRIADTKKRVHTAFWLQGDNQGNVNGTGRDGAEIDVFESVYIHDKTHTAIHADGYNENTKIRSTRDWTPENIHEGYHTYGLLWTPDRLEIFYDGESKLKYIEGQKVKGNGPDNKVPVRDLIPQVKEWIWLSVGASFGDGDFDSQSTGRLTEAKVEYVRVWKLKEQDQDQENLTHTYRIINKKTGKWIKTAGSDNYSRIIQARKNDKGDWTAWNRQEVDNKNFHFVNTGTGKFFAPKSEDNGSLLELRPNTHKASWTQWQTKDAGKGYVYIINKKTKKYLKPASDKDLANIITDDLNKNKEQINFYKWKIECIND